MQDDCSILLPFLLPSTDYKLDTKSVAKAEDACLSDHYFACTIQMYIILQVKIQSPRLKNNTLPFSPAIPKAVYHPRASKQIKLTMEEE